jgi:hypothetical protein
VSAGTDIRRALGKGLGVVATDVNGDGQMDLFVANDTVQNFLFMNRGKGKWDEIALAAEVGFSVNGTPRSGMGVDAAGLRRRRQAGPVRRQRRPGDVLALSNDGKRFFTDVAAANGVSQATRLLSGWGLKFFDYDNDGSIDLILANGHPDDMIESYSQQVRYKEPLLLFHHDGTKLANVSAQAGPAFQKAFPARGLAVGDYNNDGRVDVLDRQQRRRAGAASRTTRAAATTGSASSCRARPVIATPSAPPSPGRPAASSAAATSRTAAATCRRTTCATCSAPVPPPQAGLGWRSSGPPPAPASSA